MATKKPRGAADSIYAVYRKCQNWEAGDVLFEGEPLLWFDSLAAARVVYNESGEQARDCLMKEFEIIRRSESLEFTSGYTWATTLLGFPRERAEALSAARERVERELRDDEAGDIVERLRAAVLASDGVHLEPVYGARAWFAPGTPYRIACDSTITDRSYRVSGAISRFPGQQTVSKAT